MPNGDPPCPLCGGLIRREMGCLARCTECGRLLSVTDGYAEPMGTPDFSGADDWKAIIALQRRGLQ